MEITIIIELKQMHPIYSYLKLRHSSNFSHLEVS